MKRYIQTDTGKTAIDLLGWSCWVFQHLPFGYFKNPSDDSQILLSNKGW